MVVFGCIPVCCCCSIIEARKGFVVCGVWRVFCMPVWKLATLSCGIEPRAPGVKVGWGEKPPNPAPVKEGCRGCGCWG
jgi:hypothetical protein